MAKKVFRLHNSGATELTGWFKSDIITPEDLRSIKTDGRDVATSIPTPFATIDLVKSAFRWVAENGIKGTTAHHKLVSDALDVAQLFYLSDQFSDKIRIISIKPTSRFDEIATHGNRNHKKFVETLKLFWDQDSIEEDKLNDEVLYNFEKTQRLYLILNVENNQVIGGTSPSTLFFASPDVQKVTARLVIKVADDTLFDSNYASLPERERSFVEYIYTLAKQPQFAHSFPELYDYIDRVRQNHLSAELNQRIANIESNYIENYPPCRVLDNDNDICEVIGIRLGVKKMDPGPIESQSDFVISSDYMPHKIKPLVLPQYPFSQGWTYTTKGINWNEETRVPYKNSNSPENSVLPEQNDKYFWLTVGNFLEDKIIELPYPIDDVNFVTCGSKKHLLPLTPTFFKFFSAEKASKLLTIKERAGGNVEVELRIPVRGGDVKYKKHYSSADNNIHRLDFHLAIFPFLKSNSYKVTHTIGLLDDRLEIDSDISLSCYKNGKQNSLSAPIKRNLAEKGELLSKYYKVETQPDVFGIENELALGFVIPNMKTFDGTGEMKFAIDFGTTNTHIEYRYGDHESVPLENIPTQPFWESLLKKSTKNIDPRYINNETTFEQEIIPYLFSEKSEINFPFRTALIHNKDVDFNRDVEIITQANGYFLFNEQIEPPYFDLVTDLKWSNYASSVDTKKIELYIEYLASLTYFRTLQVGGDPSKTKITWFYPVSMDEVEIAIFSKLWRQVFEKVFNSNADKNLRVIPESVAPYYYYRSTKAGLCLSIDIGGGSSDVAVFDEDEQTPKLISSFKFAGNAIFGDGFPSVEFKNNADRNGFVKAFMDYAIKATSVNQKKSDILNKILKVHKNSADFSNFLFALEKDKTISFNYSRLIQQNKKLKLTILVFYGAIAYYSANLLKKSGVAIPKNILLSGTASKTASIIDPTDDLKNISDLFKFFFEKVYGEKIDRSIGVNLSDKPKEITCKGGLKASYNSNMVDSIPIKFWIGGVNNDVYGRVLDREGDVVNIPKYGDINDIVKRDVENAIEDFYLVIDSYLKSINVETKYALSPDTLKIFKSIRSGNTIDLLIRGIKSYYKKDESKIEETLFFYPLIGILNQLAYELSDENVE